MNVMLPAGSSGPWFRAEEGTWALQNAKPWLAMLWERGGNALPRGVEKSTLSLTHAHHTTTKESAARHHAWVFGVRDGATLVVGLVWETLLSVAGLSLRRAFVLVVAPGSMEKRSHRLQYIPFRDMLVGNLIAKIQCLVLYMRF